MDAVYIAGKGHSGTTILGLLLASHDEFFSFGEIWWLLDDWEKNGPAGVERITCSCSRSTRDCPFWAPLIDQLLSGSLGKVELYQRALDRAAVFEPRPRYVVDASKGLSHYRLTRSVTDGRVRVVLMVRDVRSWAVSRFDRNRRRGKGLVTREAFDWIRCPKVFLTWHRGNQEFLRELTDSTDDIFLLGYEELLFDPDRILERLSSFLDLDRPLRPVVKPNLTHSLRGNRVQASADKMARLQYDPRWLSRRSWILSSLALPWVMKTNRELVYSNTDFDGWRA